ncbi:MAG: 6-phosphogluconolactonase [Jiangellales bacterium]
MSAPSVMAWRDADALAETVAARLVTHLVTVQADRGHASVVLTGGSVGVSTLAALAASPGRDALDWDALDVWWGDERFVPVDDAARNERQAREALLDHVGIDESRVHPMPALGGSGTSTGDDDVQAAAAAYAAELARHSSLEAHAPLPRFDVLLLGVGPDGHVASLFPNSPALYDTRAVVGVEGSPKPPPQRISLTLPTIQTADEVWLLAAGAQKAPAVRLALSGAGPMSIPASVARGRRATSWLLDRDAASELPAGMVRPQ